MRSRSSSNFYVARMRRDDKSLTINLYLPTIENDRDGDSCELSLDKLAKTDNDRLAIETGLRERVWPEIYIRDYLIILFGSTNDRLISTFAESIRFIIVKNAGKGEKNLRR